MPAELSIFIDESGDFGSQSEAYLLTFVLHDQSNDISSQFARLSQTLKDMGYPPDNALHTGPMIRKEDEYQNVPLKDRRKLFDRLLTFARTSHVRYVTFVVDKREYPNRFKLKGRLTREVTAFLRDNIERLASFDHVIAYYDNGQSEITDLINTVFNASFFDVEFRKVLPSQYRLFQCADLLCTLELMRLKLESGRSITKSEEIFFESRRKLKKNYLKTIEKMKL